VTPAELDLRQDNSNTRLWGHHHPRSLHTWRNGRYSQISKFWIAAKEAVKQNLLNCSQGGCQTESCQVLVDSQLIPHCFNHSVDLWFFLSLFLVDDWINHCFNWTCPNISDESVW